MTRLALPAALAALTATGAMAGGIDRSGQGIDVLFEQGNVITGSMSLSMPEVSATAAALTGDIAVDYAAFSFGVKMAVTDQIDVALTYDQPFGADVSYGGLLTGVADATMSSHAYTLLGRYKFNENFSVHGGVRAQTLSANVMLPLVAGYVLDMDSDIGVGYVVGAAYERPEMALRVALTYSSAITQTLTGIEGILGGVPTSFNQSTPQSLNLDFQTGIAPGTLVFGSVRWVDWSSFSVAPPGYPANPLVSFANDTISYELGVGRQFTDRLSGAITVGYEAAEGGVFSNLGPTDGYWSVGLGGSFEVVEGTELSAGIVYRDIGDANGGALTAGAPFTGNSAIGFGMSMKTTF